jgi:hypothetical protein
MLLSSFYKKMAAAPQLRSFAPRRRIKSDKILPQHSSTRGLLCKDDKNFSFAKLMSLRLFR